MIALEQGELDVVYPCLPSDGDGSPKIGTYCGPKPPGIEPRIL